MIYVVASVLSALTLLCSAVTLWFAFRLFIEADEARKKAALEREEAEVEYRAAEWCWIRAREARSRGSWD